VERITLEQVIDKIALRLHLSKETETEVLAEIRTHLEDAIAQAVAEGQDEQTALREAAQQFGIDETGAELQELHSNHESVDALVATALPVLFAVILRWLAFAPDGSPVDWRQLLIRPGFLIVALCALIFPAILFHRWRYVLAIWGIFWFLTVIFVLFPSINRW
jgi:hypothetical protein